MLKVFSVHFNKSLTAGVLSVATLFLLGCPGRKAHGPVIPPSSDVRSLRNVILSTPKIDVANPSADPNGDILVAEHSTGFSGDGQNRVEQFEEKRHLTKTLEKFVAFNPNADALYPCSLVQGKSLPDGILSPIKTERTPATITITDFISSSPGASYSRQISNPSLDTVTLATSQILGQTLQTDQPAKLSYSETAMSSVEEGFLKLGASYKWLSGSVAGSFNTAAETSKTSLMVRFVQSYYTVTCSPPSSPDSYFSKKSRLADLRNYIGAGNPPAYISSLTYGRELWMLIQSSHDSSEVKASLSAAFNFGATGGTADLSTEQKKVLNESSIQTLILGGNGPAAIQALRGDSAKDIKDYLLSGANFSRTSPGVIISYTARYLVDNDVARVSSATDYVIHTTKANPVAVVVNAARVTWRTTGDDKDWDTQPRVDVFDTNGRLVAHIDCCSGDRNGDHWTNGRVETRNMSMVVSPLQLTAMAHGNFTSIRVPVGNDDWDYTAIVELILSDGSTKQFSCSGRNSCGANW